MNKLKVLIVDDDTSDRLLFRKWIERWGYDALDAEDAASGEKIAAEEDIAAALLDFKLPDFNGIELFRRINKLRPGIPIILITGAHKPELTIQAMSEGLYHYMSKPADMYELKIHLDRAISLQELRSDYKRLRRLRAGREGSSAHLRRCWMCSDRSGSTPTIPRLSSYLAKPGPERNLSPGLCISTR